MNKKLMLKSNISFNILKNIMGPVVKTKYKLQIENSSIVPKTGPIIICTNHLHKRDQLSVFYSINRPIHYMAKKEYFEHQPTKTLYKLWGAIPTDRSNGIEAMNICEQLLNMGEAIGIFPEGTRNSLKLNEIQDIYNKYEYFSKFTFKEFASLVKLHNPKVSQINYLENLYNLGLIDKMTYLKYILSPDYILSELLDRKIINQENYDNSLLLPLKYGAIKLAQKTGATIVTSAGNGNFDDKIIKFSYGDLFNISSDASNLDLEAYNDKIRNSIIKTYKKIR